MGAYSVQVIADGASHYWRLGEPSGTVAADSAGSAPGTISGGVTLAQPGPLADGSTAMTFNGTTGKVVTAAGVVLTPPYTVEAWVKTPSAAQLPMVSNRSVVSGSVFTWCVLSGNPFVYFQSSGGGYGGGDSAGTPGAPALANGQWHHLVLIITSAAVGTFASYADGVFYAMPNQPTAPFLASAANPLEIAWDSGGPVFWSGSLAEVAIYPTALSAPTIAAHYALRTATPGGGAPAFPWLAALVLPG